MSRQAARGDRAHREQGGVLLDHQLPHALQGVDLRPSQVLSAATVPISMASPSKGRGAISTFAFASDASLASFSSATASSRDDILAAGAWPLVRYVNP